MMNCMEMEVVDWTKEKNEEIYYLLYVNNSWQSELDICRSNSPIVESYWTSKSQLEVIKIEEMEHTTNVLKPADIMNERRIIPSPLLKKEDNVAQCYGQNQFSMDCTKEESTLLFENYSGCNKSDDITDNVAKPGERPLSCKICEKKFTRRGNLNRHI